METQSKMIKVLSTAILFITISTNLLNAQLIPEELLGDWAFEYELNACGTVVENGCDIDGLSIYQYNDNTTFDTLMITEIKHPNESFDARYHLSVIMSEPEQYEFTHIDSVGFISPWEFFAIYTSDSLTFNWTTTDPGVLKTFELIGSDSLVFYWTANCNGCNCASSSYFSRNLTSNNNHDVLESNHWSIFPNPATNIITLEKVSDQVVSNSKISLINSNGVLQKEFTTSDFNFEIPIGNLNSGIFYLKIENGDRVEIKKIVKID